MRTPYERTRTKYDTKYSWGDSLGTVVGELAGGTFAPLLLYHLRQSVP